MLKGISFFKERLGLDFKTLKEGMFSISTSLSSCVGLGFSVAVILQR